MGTQKRASVEFAQVSDHGLHMRLFSEEDVPRLKKSAREPLVHGIGRDEVVQRLDVVFFGAFRHARHARGTLWTTGISRHTRVPLMHADPGPHPRAH